MRPTGRATAYLLNNGALISVLMPQWSWGTLPSPACFSAVGRQPSLSLLSSSGCKSRAHSTGERVSYRYNNCTYIRNHGISNNYLSNFARHRGDPSLLAMTWPALSGYRGIIWVVSGHILTQRESCRILQLQLVGWLSLQGLIIFFWYTWCRVPESGSCSKKWSTLNLFSPLPVYSISSEIELYFLICLLWPTDPWSLCLFW